MPSVFVENDEVMPAKNIDSKNKLFLFVIMLYGSRQTLSNLCRTAPAPPPFFVGLPVNQIIFSNAGSFKRFFLKLCLKTLLILKGWAFSRTITEVL
jgi:hypothetical protein